MSKGVFNTLKDFCRQTRSPLVGIEFKWWLMHENRIFQVKPVKLLTIKNVC